MLVRDGAGNGDVVGHGLEVCSIASLCLCQSQSVRYTAKLRHTLLAFVEDGCARMVVALLFRVCELLLTTFVRAFLGHFVRFGEFVFLRYMLRPEMGFGWCLKVVLVGLMGSGLPVAGNRGDRSWWGTFSNVGSLFRVTQQRGVNFLCLEKAACTHWSRS